MVEKKVTQAQKHDLVKELFAKTIKKFPREKVTPKHIDETWSIDLVDQSQLAKYNKGFKFILTCIDIFSRFAWAIPIESKSSNSVSEAFKVILESGRKPKRIWCDKGKEFYNTVFKSFLSKHNMEMYSTYSELKAVFIERFNRTLREMLTIPVFIEGKANWIGKLETVLEKYNNRKHGSIKMTPVEASKKENEDAVYAQMVDKRKFRKPRYEVGDLVRIPDKRTIFSKGDTTNWSYELFRIHQVLDEKPPEYLIEDEKKEKILGIHYEQEILKSNFTFQSNRQVLKSLEIGF
ncbi:MAG: DDE-type integrase/transposase/recombinase [Chlamydiota bacterium]